MAPPCDFPYVPSTKSGRKWSRFSAGCESSIAICTRNALPLHAMSDATRVVHTYPVEEEFSQKHVAFGRFHEFAEQRDEFLHTLTGPEQDGLHISSWHDKRLCAGVMPKSCVVTAKHSKMCTKESTSTMLHAAEAEVELTPRGRSLHFG